ncbi:MAG: hypothetical protein ACRDRA_16385, partial [Pseudonocardiaceae bacterium]
MRVTPKVPTPLAEVRVRERPGAGVPDVVLVGHSATPTLGPGANQLGVNEQWLAQYGMTGSAGSVQAVPLLSA